MKRTGLIACLSILLVMIMTVTCFGAEGFKVVETSPEDGATGTSQENMGVKVTFSQNVYSKENNDANAELCVLTDNKGKKVKSHVVFDEDEPNVMLVLADDSVTVKGNTKYTLTIKAGFVSTSGEELAKDEVVSFTTLNPKNNMLINVFMMVGMVIIMIVAGRRSLQQQEEKVEKEKKEASINPYKLAKETGRPVEEIIAQQKKIREREEARAAKVAAKVAKERAKIERYKQENKVAISSDNLRVPGPRPISKYSKYKAPHK